MKTFLNRLNVSFILLNLMPSGDTKLNGQGSVCGRPIGTSFQIEESRIIAGYDVGYYRYPWFVALLASNTISCGGVLVSKKAVISAAHCYKEYIMPPHNKTVNVKLEDVYTLMLGLYNKCEKEKTQKIFGVTKVHIHEKYKEYVPYYDISLLVLKEEAHGYEPICLPKNVIKNRPKEGTVPGLGTLRYHGPVPCTLHEARLLIYPDNECKKMINRTGNDPSKIVGAFCAGYMQGGIDTCQGDSGGPFQVIDEFGNYVLLGIVSFGFHCANPGFLGMYTDVSQYLEWIQEKSGVKASMDASNSSSNQDQDSSEAVTEKPTNKPPHRNIVVRPFFRPINIFIYKNNKLVEVRKNVKQYPLGH